MVSSTLPIIVNLLQDIRLPEDFDCVFVLIDVSDLAIEEVYRLIVCDQNWFFLVAFFENVHNLFKIFNCDFRFSFEVVYPVDVLMAGLKIHCEVIHLFDQANFLCVFGVSFRSRFEFLVSIFQFGSEWVHFLRGCASLPTGGFDYL